MSNRWKASSSTTAVSSVDNMPFADGGSIGLTPCIARFALRNSALASASSWSRIASPALGAVTFDLADGLPTSRLRVFDGRNASLPARLCFFAGHLNGRSPLPYGIDQTQRTVIRRHRALTVVAPLGHLLELPNDAAGANGQTAAFAFDSRSRVMLVVAHRLEPLISLVRDTSTHHRAEIDYSRACTIPQ